MSLEKTKRRNRLYKEPVDEPVTTKKTHKIKKLPIPQWQFLEITSIDFTKYIYTVILNQLIYHVHVMYLPVYVVFLCTST